MAIRFLDPRPPTRPTVSSPARPATRREGCAIGLLANGFPDSMAFLDALALALGAIVPEARFVRVEKPSPPSPLTTAQMHLLTHDCDGIIAAYGH